MAEQNLNKVHNILTWFLILMHTEGNIGASESEARADISHSNIIKSCGPDCEVVRILSSGGQTTTGDRKEEEDTGEKKRGKEEDEREEEEEGAHLSFGEILKSKGRRSSTKGKP